MKVVVIGAKGFVGSAFVRYLKAAGVDVIEVTRGNYDQLKGTKSDIVIEASCNSKKYLADKDPARDHELSVIHRSNTLRDFPAEFQVHISSVDVYGDLTSPSTTKEDAEIDLSRISNYGINKFKAEELVKREAKRWLIVRLAGMVGEGLKKNPIFDILNGLPLRIHPESKYQFMLTDKVAEIVWKLVQQGKDKEIYNICGKGLISPNEIAQLANRKLDLSLVNDADAPRIVDINIDKINKLVDLPETKISVREFVSKQ